MISPDWLRRAALPAYQHNLSFYAAGWAAASAQVKVPLVSADRKLQGTGLAESPTQARARLQLSSR
jgi:predicted nucleic acid-binding protein